MADSGFTEAIPADGQDMSTAGKLFGVIFSPGEAFAAIARKPSFVAPLVTLVICSIVVTYAMLQKIGAVQIVQNAIAASGKAQNLSPDQLGQAAKFTAVSMWVGGVIGIPIILLIVAAIALLIVNAIFGGEIKFRTAFSVAAYADIPAVLAYIIALIMIFFGDLSHFDPRNSIPTRLAFFLDPHTVSKPLYALAEPLDAFYFWFMILLGIGLSAATGRKIKPLPIFLSFLGVWVILTVIRVGFAFI